MLAFQYIVICALVISVVFCDDTEDTNVNQTTEGKNTPVNDDQVDFSTTTLANLPDFKKVRLRLKYKSFKPF